MTAAPRPSDGELMSRALSLARMARPSPNPRVGAIIVKDGEIVAEGFHERAGLPHAEVSAIRAAGEKARGATIYVTLEPCCHQGRTGPCTEAIHAAGIDDVVVGMVDPDERVRGGGVARLEALGHRVRIGASERECRALLEGYTHHRLTGLPLVTLKAAMTLDGLIATTVGDSRWITSKESRARAHLMRADADAVVIGRNTAVTDDPLLTVRHVQGLTPLRVVMDSGLRTPPTAKLLNSPGEGEVVLAYCDAPDDRVAAVESLEGVTALRCDRSDSGGVSPRSLLEMLAARGVMSVLVEGGAKVHGAFARAGLAHKAAVFIAPKLLGGGAPWVSFSGVRKMADALTLVDLECSSIGPDVLLEARFEEQPPAE